MVIREGCADRNVYLKSAIRSVKEQFWSAKRIILMQL